MEAITPPPLEDAPVCTPGCCCGARLRLSVAAGSRCPVLVKLLREPHGTLRTSLAR